MKKISIRSSNKKPSESEILAFEEKNSIVLPKNFKNFIQKKYNGGLVSDHDEVKLFKSLKYGNRLIEDSLKNFQAKENLVSANLLPIAEDYSGNPIILDLTNGKVGTIYLDSGEEDPDYFAESFEEFLGVKNVNDF